MKFECRIHKPHRIIIGCYKKYCGRNMPGSNVLTRSRARMRLFPEVFAQCSAEAAFYGKCVAATTTGKQELSKNMCAKEFEALKSCFQSAMKKAVK